MTTLVYGEALGSLVFIAEDRARALAEIQQLRQDGHLTWGVFRSRAPESIRHEASEWYDADEQPKDEEPFLPPDDIIDEWPFPHQEQIAFLPKDVVQLGVIEDTIHSGERLDFAQSAEVEVVKRLQSHGFLVRRDDNLVQAACGELE